MTLKQFVKTLPEDIDDEEVMIAYNKYKEAFGNKQVTDYFALHSQEAWCVDVEGVVWAGVVDGRHGLPWVQVPGAVPSGGHGAAAN